MIDEQMVGELLRRIASLEAQLGRLVLVAPLVRVSSSGEGDQIQAAPQDGTTPQRAFTGKRFQHAGFKSTPVIDASARGVIAFARNGIMNGAIVAEDDGYDPGLAAGELVIYSPTKHACRIYFDNAGAMVIAAEPGQNITVQASGTGEVNVTATAVTGKVGLGPVANLAVLVQGAFDGLGVPVTQAPAAIATVVKAG